MGVSLIGHSSGAHISLLSLIRKLELKLGKRNSEEIPQDMLDVEFDSFTSLAGVFSISDHFHHEVGRGVEEISPMKPACDFTKESFDYYSPTWRLQDIARNYTSASFPTSMLFLHSLEDDVVPCTSTQKVVSAIKKAGPTKCRETYLPHTNHVEIVTDLMLGGKLRNIVMQWLREGTQRMPGGT